jgi:hypothetical protein
VYGICAQLSDAGYCPLGTWPDIPLHTPCPALPQIIPFDSYLAMMTAFNQLPPSVEHIVLCLTIPPIYPHLKRGVPGLKLYDMLNSIPGFKWIFNKAGMWRDLGWRCCVLLCTAVYCCVLLCTAVDYNLL